MDESELTPRAIPVQPRARETVDQLLTVAAQLLDEVGMEGLTTNLLAARAGVRIRTVYRYFPNKLAVVCAVAARLAEAELGHVDGFAAVSDPGLAPAEAVTQVVDAYLRGAHAQPGFLAVRKAMRAVPALQAIEREANRALSERLAAMMRARGLSVSPARAQVLASVMVECVASVTDLALTRPAPEARRLVTELKAMLTAHLTAHAARASRR